MDNWRSSGLLLSADLTEAHLKNPDVMIDSARGIIVWRMLLTTS